MSVVIVIPKKKPKQNVCNTNTQQYWYREQIVFGTEIAAAHNTGNSMQYVNEAKPTYNSYSRHTELWQILIARE